MGLIGKIMVKLGLDSSEFQKGAKDAESTTASFGDKIKGMAVKAAAAIGVLTLLKKAFDFGKEAYNTAAQAEGVERAFARLNNPNLLNELREATQGTVSDLELMQNAIQAKNFKIPLENLASYLKFANQRAKETGQSVDYLVQSIVLGVGRKSPLILDNLGISALEVREEFAKTGDMAKAVADIINKEMGSANDTLVGSKELAGQNAAAWQNALAVFGKSTVIKTLGDWFNQASTATANFLSSLLGTTKELGSNEQAVRSEGREINMLIAQLTNANAKESERKIILDKLREVQPKIVEGIDSENIATKKLIVTAREYNKELVARIALAARQDSVTAAVNRQIEAGTNVMNKEAEVARFLLDLQSDLTTADIEKGFLNQTQGITRWRKITNEERAKIISDYSEIVSGTGEWNDKMAAAYKLFGNNYMSIEKIRGINLKPFFSFAKDIGELTRELNDAGKQAEIAKQEVEDFKKTFSQLFETVTPTQQQEQITQFKELVTQIQKAEAKVANLRRQVQKEGITDTLTESIATASNEFTGLTEQYTKLTGKEWGAKVKVETDKDQLKNAASGTIAFLENEISERQLMIKLTTSDTDIKKWQKEIEGFETIIKAKLEIEKPKSERQVIEDAIKGYEDLQIAIPIGIGSPDEIVSAQNEWDRLQGLIKQVKEELEKFPKAPKEIFPVGSLADFDQQIADIDANINKLTGSELAAAQAARAMLEIRKEGATNSWQTQLEKETTKLNLLKKALEEATEAQRKYAQEAVNAQQAVVDGLTGADIAMKNAEQISEQFARVLAETAIDSLQTLADSMVGLSDASPEEAISALLMPFADMAISAGMLIMTTGTAIEALKASLISFFGGSAIAAGAALVAIGVAAKAGLGALAKSGAANSANSTNSNPNTFTGGYSNGGSTRTAQSLQLATPQPQVVVLETRVSGSDIVLAANKEQQRRKR